MNAFGQTAKFSMQSDRHVDDVARGTKKVLYFHYTLAREMKCPTFRLVSFGVTAVDVICFFYCRTRKKTSGELHKNRRLLHTFGDLIVGIFWTRPWGSLTSISLKAYLWICHTEFRGDRVLLIKYCESCRMCRVAVSSTFYRMTLSNDATSFLLHNLVHCISLYSLVRS